MKRLLITVFLLCGFLPWPILMVYLFYVGNREGFISDKFLNLEGYSFLLLPSFIICGGFLVEMLENYLYERRRRT
jgi:hypothetical protein